MDARASSNFILAQFLQRGMDINRVRRMLALTDMHMLEGGIHTDITLHATDGTVKAHRFVLMASSTVLKTMLLLNNRVRAEGTLELAMSLTALKVLLILLYSDGEQEKIIRIFRAAIDMHFEEIFDACHLFQITRLVPILDDAISRHVNRANCWDWYRKSKEIHNACEGQVRGDCLLPQICINYIVDHSVAFNP